MTCQLYPPTTLPDSPRCQVDELSGNDDTDVLARLRRLEEIVLTNAPASSPLGQTSTQATSLPSPPARQSNQAEIIQEAQSSAEAVTLLESEITSSGSKVGLPSQIKLWEIDRSQKWTG
jgi:hypothetical protein